MHGRTRQFLHDALEESLALRDDLTGASFHTYSRSRQLQRISERSLEIIGEALRRALDEDPRLLTDDILLRDWVNLRNVISHQYDNLLLEIIWEASTVELATLITALESLVSEPR